METVKLQCYQFLPEEIVIDSIQGKSFDDFILIEANTSNMSSEEAMYFMQNLNETLQRLETDKQFVVTDSNVELQFYGVREVQEEATPSDH